MLAHLNCVIIDADATNRQELAAFMVDHGVVVSAVMSSIDGFRAFAKQQLQQPSEPLHLVLLNIDPHPEETLKLAAPLIKEFKSISFFLMSQNTDSATLMEVIHIGAREFIPLPMRPERLIASMERIAQLDPDEKRARIIQIVPVVGGCGATSIACNVAATLAKNGKTLLLDMDLVCGAVAANFNLSPRYTIADVTASNTLDRHLVENAMATHPQTGLHVLGRPEHPEDALRVTRTGISRLLSVASRLFEYIVIDSVLSADPVYLAMTQASHVNVMVMELNVPAARNAERFMGILTRAGIDTDKVKVIVNRFEKRGSDIKPDDLEKTLGLKIAWMVPNDFKNAIAAINFGQPAVVRSPRSEMSGSIHGLAQMLNGKNAAH